MKARKNANNRIEILPELLYNRLFSMLPLLKSYYHGSKDEFWDLFHDLYLTVYDNIHRLKNLEAFEKWALIIFIHQQKNPWSYPLDCHLPDGMDPYQPVIVKHLLGSNLEKLSDQEKLILKKNILEGYTLKEISSLYEISYGHVRTIKHRALHKLRKSIK